MFFNKLNVILLKTLIKIFIMLKEIFSVLVFSLLQALASTFLSIIMALPIAHFFWKFNFAFKNFFLLLFPIFSILPTKLVALSVIGFYGESFSACFFGFFGIIVAHLVMNVPFAIYIILSGYYKFDANFLCIAQEAGAYGWRGYRDIIFQILRPTIISVFTLLFLLHFSSFSIPLFIGKIVINKNYFCNTLDISVYNFYLNSDRALALTSWALRVLVILLLFFVSNKIFGKTCKREIKLSSCPVKYYSQNFGFFKLFNFKNLFYIFYIIFALFIILGPIINFFIKACDRKVFEFIYSIFSFSGDKFLGEPVCKIILNSLILAFTSAFGAVFIAGIICAIELNYKGWRAKRAKTIISILTYLPFMVGSVATGIIFSCFSSFCVGNMGDKFFFAAGIISFFAGFLSHVFLNYAFAYRVIRSQAILWHQDLTMMGQASGATYWQVMRYAYIPFIWPAFLKAYCVCFGLSLTEVGACFAIQGLCGKTTWMTIPMAIKIYRQVNNGPAYIGLSLILLFLVFIFALFSTCLAKNK